MSTTPELERVLARFDIIMTTTDRKGIITSANDVFQKITAITEAQAVGKPHNIVRHPDMPAGVYKLMWDTLTAGQEFRGFIKNRAQDGAFYWVLAHIKPVYDSTGQHVGFHSLRRALGTKIIQNITPLYAYMKSAEKGLNNKERAEASLAQLNAYLTNYGLTYNDWVTQQIKANSI